MTKIISYVLASLFLVCAIIPLFYGIFNIGTAALYAFAAFFFLLPTAWRLLERAPVLRNFLAVLAALFILYCLTVSAIMAYKAWFDDPPTEGAATVVVLGAKVTGNQPSLMLRRRLNVAAVYLRENESAVCVVTGGQGLDEDYPEAHVMAAYLEGLGIAPDRIKVEDASTNTRENFRLSAGFIEPDVPVVIVTDSFHQLRASIFASSDYENIPDFYALSSYTPWGLFPSYWVRDMFGVGVAWLQTRLG
ncbi:MAG: YdcF family protein [Oscillospiraceae bacterium]|nr:YdcF family protein [Oscillospiraceae bacterium]